MRQHEVVAILCSDIHLSHRPPIARSAEPDWYAAMERPLAELRTLKTKHDVPVVCAGDIFDHWKSPPELINFALDALPKMYAIPGQHDLPCHSYDDRHKSAFQTLVSSKRVTLIEPDQPINMISKGCDLMLHGFPWGHKIRPLKSEWQLALHVAVIHAYVWKTGHSFPGAPKESKAGRFKSQLEGYDVAAFGDNHKGFKELLSREGGNDTTIFNCGGFMRRKIDEMGSKPRVGLLRADGTITEHELDCSEDKFIDVDSALAPIEKILDMGLFLAELASLGDSGLNFVDAVKNFLTKNNVNDQVRSVIAEALNGGKS